MCHKIYVAKVNDRLTVRPYDTRFCLCHQDVLDIVDTGNCLVPAQNQAITKYNAGLLSVPPEEQTAVEFEWKL